MTTFRQLQDETLLALYGYGLSQPRATTLTADPGTGSTSFAVVSAADLEQGLAEVDSELVFIQSVDRGSSIATVVRGYYGTTAATHAIGATLTMAPTWPRTRVQSAINDTIVSTYPDLFGVAQAQFTFNPSQTTYSLPGEAERILRVTADVNGPSLEQQIVNRYSFNSVAPTDDWATTNTITLQEGVTPGRTVTVTYMKQPSALAADGDALTTSGLRESAKLAIIYGACSQLLAFMDVSRLGVDTAQADEFDSKNQIGRATQLSGQLQVRYQMELDKERKRLRATTSVAVSVRKR